MLTYDLKVGYSCNNKCKHCVIDDSKDRLLNEKLSIDLSTEECVKQIDFAVKQCAKYIVLTGGEITIRNDFQLIFDYCVKNNLDITIQTNGRRLFVPEIADKILQYDRVKIVVALHGAAASVHDKITQVNGSFEETCKGIQYMCEKNICVVLKVVISKLNQDYLLDIIKLANQLGVKYICFAFPHGQGAARKNFVEIIPRYSDLSYVLKKMVKISMKLGVSIEFEAIPFCIIPYAMQLVGELKYLFNDTLCTQVRENTFNWEQVRKSIKRKTDKCKACDMERYCEGVWFEYSDAFGFDEFVPLKIPFEIKEKLSVLYSNNKNDK